MRSGATLTHVELARERRRGDGVGRRRAPARDASKRNFWPLAWLSISCGTGSGDPRPSPLSRTSHSPRRRLSCASTSSRRRRAGGSRHGRCRRGPEPDADVDRDGYGLADQGRHEDEAEVRRSSSTFVKNNADSKTTADEDRDRLPEDRQALRPRASTSARRPTIEAIGRQRLPAEVQGRHRRRPRRSSTRPPTASPLNFNVTAVRRRQEPRDLLHRAQGGTVVERPSARQDLEGSGKFAQKLTITIPPDLQQPAPGIYSR